MLRRVRPCEARAAMIGALTFGSLLLSPVAACTGAPTSAQSSPPQVREAGTLTLSPSGCVYQGTNTLPAGTVAVHAVNQTTTDLYVDFLLLHSSDQYAELAAYIADEEKRILAGTEPIGPPTYVSLMSHDLVPAGSTTKLITVLVAGTYGLVCSQATTRGALGIWLFGPITLTS